LSASINAGDLLQLNACALCKRLEVRHIRTKPYTPKINGKAERFIQTSLRERAYANAY
jgi:transposase InsO family protein